MNVDTVDATLWAEVYLCTNKIKQNVPKMLALGSKLEYPNFLK